MHGGHYGMPSLYCFLYLAIFSFIIIIIIIIISIQKIYQ